MNPRENIAEINQERNIKKEIQLHKYVILKDFFQNEWKTITQVKKGHGHENLEHEVYIRMNLEKVYKA